MQSCYSLLPVHIHGSRWAFDFADAIHYLAAHRGQPVSITARACLTLMNGLPVSTQRYDSLRHRFMESWKQAEKAGWLVECTPPALKAEKGNTGSLRLSYRSPRRIYYFAIPSPPQSGDSEYLRKPRGYVENGWLNLLRSVYSKRLLNHLLHLGQCSADIPLPNITGMLQQFAKLSQTTLHPSRIQTAFEQLVTLNLVTRQGDRWQVNWPRFQQPAPTRPALKFAGQPVFEADWLTAQVIDISRAELARQVMAQGRWSPLLYWRIFTDIETAAPAQRQQALARVTALPAPVEGVRHRLEWVHLWGQVVG